MLRRKGAILTSVTRSGSGAMARSREGTIMRTIVNWLTVLVFCSAASTAQQAAAPETARQALLEMFFSKTPGTLVKHLPAVTRAALEKSGTMASLEQYSLLATRLETQGQNYQTFETGPVLLSGEDPKTAQKLEVTVEKDALRGDQDDIELSFQTYQHGQPQRTPFMPRMTFSMKQEAHLWTLSEISITLHLPLTDPDLLKAFTNGMQATHSAGASNVAFTPRSENTAPPAGTDAQVLAAMHTILSAEVTYAVTYPNAGFTCTLSDLDGFGGGDPNEHQAMLINSGLASGRRYGYVFTLSGCGMAPGRTFHLLASPNVNAIGRKAFCADQSNTIRSTNDGNPQTCFATGTPVQ